MHDNSGISVFSYRLVFAMTYSTEVPSIPLFCSDVATFSFNAKIHTTLVYNKKAFLSRLFKKYFERSRAKEQPIREAFIKEHDYYGENK